MIGCKMQAVLVMPFFSKDDGDDRERSLLFQALFKQLSNHFNFTLQIILPDVKGQRTLGKVYYEQLTKCELVIADMYSNNENVAIEVTISCLHGINTYLMAPHRNKDDRYDIAAYFNPYIGFRYSEDQVQDLRSRIERDLAAPQDKIRWYQDLGNVNNNLYDACQSWFDKYCKNDRGSAPFLDKLLSDFERIVDGKFEFGKPLLDEMNRSPFTQLDTTTHLLFLESMAEEVWIFANDVTIGIEESVQSIMFKNILKNTKYRYIVPDEGEVRDNVDLLKSDIAKMLTQEGQPHLIENFKVKYVSKQMLSQEVTILDPTSSHRSAYLLEVYEDTRYVLRLNDSETNKARAKHKRLWEYDWEVMKKPLQQT